MNVQRGQEHLVSANIRRFQCVVMALILYLKGKPFAVISLS